MKFFTQQVRTLLLVTVLVFGAVCLSGCKTKQEKLRDDFVNAMEEPSKENAKWRSMASEAGMMLAAYESSVLAAVVEMGDKFTKKDLTFDPPKESKYFTYTVSEDGASCTATARKDIGYFKKGSTITTKYDKVKEDFVYSSNQLDVAKKLLLTFFTNRNVEDASPSNQQSGGGNKGGASAKHWTKESAKNEWGEVSSHYYLQTVSADGTIDNDPKKWKQFCVAYYGGDKLALIIVKEFDVFVIEDGQKVTATLRDEAGTETSFSGNYVEASSNSKTEVIMFKDVNFVRMLQKNANYKVLVSWRGEGNWSSGNIRATINGSLPAESVQSSAKSSTDGCSFAGLKTPPLVTFSSTDEDSKSWDEGWYDINLYVNPQTKDSILTMESYGGKGKEAYKFVFNKNLTDAEVTLCCFESVESSLCGEKKTLKTSKDAEKELREAFQTAKKELSMKLSGSGGGNATEYVKSGTQYLDRGDKNNNKADFDLAIAEFDRAIKLDPNIAEAYFGRGRGYLRKGDNSRAVADYSQAIRLNPNDIISYSNRGRAYARMGDYDNAVADFESALRIDPNNTAIKQNLEKARKKEKGL